MTKIINELGEESYVVESPLEIKRALSEHKSKYKALGQNTARTLIDTMNRYLTNCPMSEYAIHTTITQNEANLSFVSHGKETIFQVTDCRNIEACYEELLDFVIQKAFPQ